ncbi:hypothetical protein [Streptomyces sp. NPDC091259]|uniref:hypothetical protein n=1 Tax=Streptomyces sp. NPDC091259 TaxID=3365976 RepID=UPI0037FB1AA7
MTINRPESLFAGVRPDQYENPRPQSAQIIGLLSRLVGQPPTSTAVEEVRFVHFEERAREAFAQAVLLSTGRLSTARYSPGRNPTFLLLYSLMTGPGSLRRAVIDFPRHPV